MKTPDAQAPESFSSSGKSRWWYTLRIFLFSLATNFWPLLLFASQKIFVLPGILLAGFGDAAYRRDMLIALLISLVGWLVYITQFDNVYSGIHLLGFVSFVLAMPIVNHAVRHDDMVLRRFLTYFTLFNVAMGFYLLVSDLDLYGLRGLNRIEGTDGITYRVYFESSSLAAIFLLNSFRNRGLQIAALAVAVAFVVFVAKSVVIMALLGFNLALPYILRSSLPFKVIVVVTALTAATLIYIYLPVIRPDIDLSLRAKQFQLDIILGLMPDNWTGWGWGSFLPQLSTDREQPYQVEMQLPMLLLQLGPIAVAAIMALTLMLFLSASERSVRGVARFAVYALIGFNNPWLFMPSWYLTCQLLFRDDDRSEKLAQPTGAHAGLSR
ncbi:MAG: hypothetical protein ABI898_02800 [Sphingomonadales bacterium]